MAREHLLQNLSPFASRNVWQANHACVRLTIQKHERREIGVEGDHDPFRFDGKSQQLPVPWIGTNVASVENIVPLLTEPEDDPSPGAPVDEELHDTATWTASRVSWAIAA